MRTLADLPLLTLTQPLTGTVAEHRFVTNAGAYPAAGGRVLGVTPDGGVSGDTVSAIVAGLILVEAGGVIAVGDVIASDATGRAVAQTATQAGAGTVTAAIAGGSAGNHTVTGIATTDTLISVVRLNRDATAANIDISAITSEFTITAASTINNAGGTDTTGDTLLITYRDASAVTYTAGIARTAAAAAGDPVLILKGVL